MWKVVTRGGGMMAKPWKTKDINTILTKLFIIISSVWYLYEIKILKKHPFIFVAKSSQHPSFAIHVFRDVTRMLIGEGGIHIFMFCLEDFFWIWVDYKRNPSGITQIYMNTSPQLSLKLRPHMLCLRVFQGPKAPKQNLKNAPKSLAERCQFNSRNVEILLIALKLHSHIHFSHLKKKNLDPWPLLMKNENEIWDRS